MNKFFAGKIGTVLLVCVGLLSGCTVSVNTNVPHSEKTNMAKDGLPLMDTIPWGPQQTMTYAIYTGTAESGSVEIEVTRAADGETYRITKVKTTAEEEIQSGATVKADTLMPTESYYNKTSASETYKISTSYAESWNVKTVTDNEVDQTIALTPSYYDNESLLVILGALSFEDTDKFAINDTIPLTCKIEVLSGKCHEKEKVSVPFGEADCYQVTLGNMRLWYSADDRVLYQYQDGNISYQLTALTQTESE